MVSISDSIKEYHEKKLVIEDKILQLKQMKAVAPELIQAAEQELTDLSIVYNQPATTSQQIGSTLANQEFKREAISKQQKVPKDNNIGTVQTVKLDSPNDLVNYINATQHINPWQRERQCDIDLKNLVMFVNMDINNQLGHISEAIKALKSLGN